MSAQSDYLLDRHNGIRNDVASWHYPDLLPAVRMPSVSWDDELASLALFNAKTCQFAKDLCRNTRKFLKIH
jgi:hypothetical protein